MKTKPVEEFDLRALILHPNPINRQYLWQAILADIHFDTVKATKDASELLDHLEFAEPYHVVLVSTDIEWNDRERIISEAKTKKGGELAAYILVVGGDSKETAKLSAEMTGDYNGILLEPYSAENLRIVAETSKRVVGAALEKRKRLGMETNLKEVRKSLDVVALDIYMEDDHRRHLKEFREVCQTTRIIAERSPELYFEIMTDIFSKASPRTAKKVDVDSVYSGPSQRIRKRIKEKMVAEKGEAEN